jgi:predicted DNA-binding protein with PD1-like motif
MNGENYLHLHITIGNIEKNEVFAGHLNSAVVGATAEIVISIIDGEVSRRKDDTIGLNLITF